MKEFTAGGVTYRLIKRTYVPDKLNQDDVQYVLQAWNNKGEWFDSRVFVNALVAKNYAAKMIEFDGRFCEEVIDVEVNSTSATVHDNVKEKNRRQVITDMCMAWRHDYGLLAEKDPGGFSHPYLSGMTDEERQQLWDRMAQVFDNAIAPRVWFRNL